MGKDQETKSSTVSEVPKWLESGSKTAVKMGTDLAATPYASNVKGTAAFNSTQQSVFDKIKALIMGEGPDTTSALADAASAPGQSISTERVVDEDGRLGSINDYVNPYAEGALAPALRKIQEAADAQRKQIGASATSASAFGDSRHGILENSLNANTSQAIGDTASTFLKGVFDTAMAQRNTDLNRFQDTDKSNASYAEQALARKSQGAKDLQNQILAQLEAGLSTGNQQQANEQSKLDATWADKEAGKNYKFDVLQALTAALSGVPYTKTQNTTETSPDNSLWQLGGAIAGKAAAPLASAAGTALAAFI